jgi:hypothetical protein
MWEGGNGAKYYYPAANLARKKAQMKQCKFLSGEDKGCPCEARWQCPFSYCKNDNLNDESKSS